ncbi:hypothetical protein QBC37DRAFT_390655 [Rhypophila decipiens]|uniref:Tyrosinase copper-binding domain-containing protein n=1 Tax=Rhypophila decipiens TaxID=261697 RepID=A0AAN6Y1B7_9PEZI|nr:hypothetical protein QBC37DRAFT_390655 [Rhypophila decipiens]
MRFALVPTLLLGAAVSTVTAAPQLERLAASDGDTVLAALQKQAEDALKQQEAAKEAVSKRGACHLGNAAIRRDWEHLSSPEKKDYIRAVNCLWDLPSVDPAFSAARNHFDDYVAVHMNQTNTIHGTANFLTWHRYLVYLWEQKLRNKCGYKGYLPYWNWFKYQTDLHQSPVFDGSDTSLGGDGQFFAHNGSVVGAGRIWLPSGAGGGCVKSGPFVNRTINIGPVQPAMQGYTPVFTDVKAYNPRCQRRDLTMAASTSTFTASNLLNVTLGLASATVGHFQDELQGSLGTLRLHGAGHYAMGGDGSDVFTSLNDPAFYLHHAMIDRVYWIWQLLHPAEANKVNGTITFRNNPPSRVGTVNDWLDMGKLGPQVQIKDVLNTLGGGPLCYIYL